MKVVLAYSGGLDTSVMAHWIKNKYKCKLIACCVDIGQRQDFKKIKERAIISGADEFFLLDAKEEFVNDFIIPALKAQATYEGRYLLATALARPLIAKKIVEVAKKTNSDTLAHGATGKGNDQVRFELSFKYLAPELKVIAPWREWELKSRQDEINYALKYKIPICQEARKYSIDQNIWHISSEGGELEEIEKPHKFKGYILPPEKAPDKPTFISISFRKGTPKKLNGEEIKLPKLIEKLNVIGAKNSIGTVDMVENRIIGIKSHGIYESPAATILYFAHRELETITLDRETFHFKSLISSKYGEIIYNGLWFNPLREALDSFVNRTQEYVTGEIKLKLYKGNISTCYRKSPYSLYLREYVTFEKEEIFNQKDATGFLNIHTLPMKILSKVRKGRGSV